MGLEPAARGGPGLMAAPLGTPNSSDVTPLRSGRYTMNSRSVAGIPVISAAVVSGNFGCPIPSQRHLPASVFAYRSKPLEAIAVMFAPARFLLAIVHRA